MPANASRRARRAPSSTRRATPTPLACCRRCRKKVGRGQRLYQIPGSMPPITALPPGCAYHPRCERATERCRREIPVLEDGTACFHPLAPAEAAS
ncbi:MAG: hypothetical protein M5U35_09440 [Roseovarius sp.]|nr:hypothetical protein [Roseovarius sp.]